MFYFFRFFRGMRFKEEVIRRILKFMFNLGFFNICSIDNLLFNVWLNMFKLVKNI